MSDPLFTAEDVVLLREEAAEYHQKAAPYLRYSPGNAHGLRMHAMGDAYINLAARIQHYLDQQMSGSREQRRRVFLQDALSRAHHQWLTENPE